MERFTTYRCDKCKRTIILDNDPAHVQITSIRRSSDEQNIDASTINNCIITKGCEGKLYPISKQNARSVSRTLASDTVKDWIPRGTSVASPESVSSDSYFSLVSNSSNVLTFGILNGLETSGTLKIYSQQEITRKSFDDFKFLVTTFPTYIITGKDRTGKVLSFTNTDIVDVKIDGVSVAEGLVWNRQSALNNGIFNIIRFDTAITSQRLVQITVIKTASSINFKTIPYSIHVNGTSASAWSNLSSVYINSERYTLYTLNFVGNFSANTILSFKSDSFDNGSIPLSNVVFFLSKQPWTSKDRILTHVFKPTEANVVRYYELDNKTKIDIISSSITSIFPPIYYSQTDLFNIAIENTIADKSGVIFVDVPTTTKIIGAY